MSAPNTNVKEQEKKHKSPLMGMTAVVAFAAVLLVGLIVYLSVGGNEPGNDQPIEADQAGASTEAEPGSAADGETGSATEAQQ